MLIAGQGMPVRIVMAVPRRLLPPQVPRRCENGLEKMNSALLLVFS